MPPASHPWAPAASDVDGDDRTIAVGRHHLDGEIVEHTAVDQQMSRRVDRRDEPRQGHARGDGRGQLAPSVHDRLAAGEVGADGERRDGELLDVPSPIRRRTASASPLVRRNDSREERESLSLSDPSFD